MTDHPTIEKSQLQPGDILFYRTTKDNGAGFAGLEANDIKSDFTVLAAFAQGLPYYGRYELYRPWFHTAVYVGDGEIVGFDDLAYESDYTDVPKLLKVPLDLIGLDALSVAVDVMRPPAEIASSIVAESLAMVSASTDYSLEGLLAFALATLGWMLPKSPLRETALLEARGANYYARLAHGSSAETCVTAAAKSIEKASSNSLCFEEPPVLPRCYSRGSNIANSIDDTIDRIRDRVASGQLSNFFTYSRLDVERMNALNVQSYDSLAGQESAELLNVLGLQAGLDLMAINRIPQSFRTGLPEGFLELLPDNHELQTDHDIWIPGGVITDPGTAIALVEKGLLALKLPPNSDLKQQGVADQSSLTADHLTLSPAMLWDALVIECFANLGTVVS